MPKPAASIFPILWLNPTERDRVELAIITETKTVKLTENARAQALPALIEKLLAKAGLALPDLRAIAVSNQPGSLTGTRIGVTIANTLGWLNKLPIIELATTDLAEIQKQLDNGKIATKPVAAVKDEVVY